MKRVNAVTATKEEAAITINNDVSMLEELFPNNPFPNTGVELFWPLAIYSKFSPKFINKKANNEQRRLTFCSLLAICAIF